MRVDTPVYDVVGVGFGPSNLSLAIALAEHNATAATPLTARFLERQPRFGWHRGMLLDDATMQVSFLKDLVTLRNPTSEFSFVAYLHSRGRLVDFVNHKSLFPLRVEFHDYFEWCAAKMAEQVLYGQEVAAVNPVVVDGAVAYFDVVSRPTDGGEPKTVRARNLVLATGLRPNLPDGVSAGERIWHNSTLLRDIDNVPEAAKRFVVVGAGQSAAEATAFLHTRFGDAEVCSVFSRFGYSPADDSAFANRVFDPAAVDEYYLAPEEAKRKIMGYHANTNYSVVDIDLIDDLYKRMYQEKVLGKQRLRMFNVSRPVDVADLGDRVRVTVESMTSGERTVLEADVVVYATGYRGDDSLALLGDLAGECARDDQGRLQVSRDYRVHTSADIAAGIYVQGGATEHSHGITSSLLSNNAVRSGEILDAILRGDRTPVPAAELALSTLG
ncbi:L-ornithine N5-oxygenase [Actinokineospora alba]|uniref:L-lysine N6-monooxygenase MbtG n=1 Tax=Actinokineospora alba TaxID=504798 RepID=A0A1H0UUB3_9PSEU|nr:lysine N(6)-hydroxylase/L-ornithine N(5)-oxygenase family protein [Actinokineospora alba]TDP69056.1 L-ornithine N5-oxygenase [Actinokineospora alba]SDI78529.1 L-ornithine N5-oxygenase [Actinokineospora alba]SDP69760.1 L-ornithine N5-oxygenase [Actinokineospora alba]